MFNCVGYVTNNTARQLLERRIKSDSRSVDLSSQITKPLARALLDFMKVLSAVLFRWSWIH